jgi:peroxiredoxin
MKPLRLIRDLWAAAGLGRRARMLEPGEAAPDFAVRSHLGTEIRLADLRGRHIVLWFFPKADTPG